ASAEQQSRVFQEVAKRLNERLASHGVAGKGPMTEASVRQALDHLARGGPEAMSATVDVTHGRGMFPMFVVALLPCAAFFLLAGSALYLQYRYECACFFDPGFVPLGPPLPDGPLDPGRRALLQAQNPAWCYTCNAYRPIRSKHCGQCGRCCEEFDHHCPVVGTCVARGNRREFLGYLLTLFGAEAVMLGMGVRYCRLLILRALHLRTLPGLLEVLPHMALVWRASPGVLYMLVLTVGICMGTAALLGRALWGTAAALTTNEMILRRRYAYLQDTQGLYSNPFDMGAWQNCLAFWSTARPDWYSVYSEHCTALREGEEPLAHPLATRILRRWDRARAALERARFEKKARREEELLRRGSQLAASEGEAESEIEA
ncbi:hypothetical protein APUTEX25_002666, partial [Auxenochlorella protothecoides]